MLGHRIVKVWQAVIGAQVTELEAGHASAMLDQEREHLRRKVLRYNRALAGHAAICEKLRSRIERLNRQQRALPQDIAACLEQGRRELAADKALRLERVGTELAQTEQELQQADATYADLERTRDLAVRRARGKIEGLKRGIGELQVQQTLAELTETAADMHGELGVDDGTLERIRERLEDKRDFAAGRVRVARGSLNSEDALADREAEAAQARAALARFETARGAAPDGEPEAS